MSGTPNGKQAGRVLGQRSRSAYETAGPAQLAAQPARARPQPVQNSMQWNVMRQHLEAGMAMQRAWRTSWAQHWQLLETYILPRRGIFINTAMPTPNTMIRGLPINQNILDPTGTQAMRVCSAGLMSGLMSPGRPWFKLKPNFVELEELDGEAQTWFETVNERMEVVMARSNFYDSAAQMFEDLTVFGTGPFLIYEDDRDVIRCYVPCPGEYFLSSSSANRVETFRRQFVMTVSQIVEMFTLERCPRDVQELWATKGSALEIERIVAHSIEPNFPVQVGSTEVVELKGSFPWREYYWVWGFASEQPLSERGFYSQPHVVPRWAVTSNDAYGRSVGMDCLPDIMQLQVMTARFAEAVEKLVRPPLQASVEMKNEPSSILPGHITYVPKLGPETGMRPVFQVNPEIKEMAENIEKIEQRVQRGFFNDLFLMMSQATKDMTAYEVAQRQNEKLQVLGPVIERWQNEFASPAIKRVYSIMAAKNLLPPMPKSLRGGRAFVGVEYTSILAIAQKASSTVSMDAFAKMVGYLAGAYPEAKLVLDPIKFLQRYASDLNTPHDVQRPNDEIQQMMKQQQQQQEAQAQMATAQSMAQGAQTLSQTQLGGGKNALDAVLGQAGQQPAEAA